VTPTERKTKDPPMRNGTYPPSPNGWNAPPQLPMSVCGPQANPTNEDKYLMKSPVWATEQAEIYAVVHHLTSDYAARARRPLPAVNGPEFLEADRPTQVAALLLLAAAYLIGAEMADEAFCADYGGRYHRPNLIPAITELDRRRYAPTGDRELWVRYGPDGPPAELREAA
jgi:hypothetical protein